MNKKKQDIQGFDYPDLGLSDDQPPKNQEKDIQPSGEPTKKTKTDESIFKTNQVQAKITKLQKQSSSHNQTTKSSPAFFPPPPGAPNKGASFWVPPPPVAQKTSPQPQQTYQPRPQFQKNQFVPTRDNRQKRNTVWVKNIPKSFNTQEKLMTFFKNEGAIKQIKVIQGEQSAIIRFVKQENAAKFLKSSKIIFNRSYIVYGQNENLSVSQQQVTDRINDEMGNVKKAQQTNLKVVKEKVSNQLAENIRALYFIQNHIVEEDSEDIKNLKSQLDKQLENKINSKRNLQSSNNQQFKPETHNTNDYNWSLVFTKKSNSGIDKKSLFAEFLKYGPIVTIQYECLSQKPFQIQNEQENSETFRPILEYKVRVLFLSIKHAWAVYFARKDELGLLVEGHQVLKYFDSGKLKIVQIKKTPQIESASQHLPIELKPESHQIEPIQWPSGPQNENVGQVQNGQINDHE